MALTVWEGVKVAGNALVSIAVDAEKFEDENPDQKFQPDTGYITQYVIKVLGDLGAEIMD